ncbi:MAG: hypothetical protein DRI84_05550 [Bacteroidetes bacterium]|nr:MAG: hypothetical protein DRI84_05550 [Bacteroidota bacterium]
MEKYTLDKYHYFEILDRSHVANDHFYEYVETHPAVQANPELKKRAEEVTALMYRFYCLTSAYLDNDNANRATEYEYED